jgi:hypothetical protein
VHLSLEQFCEVVKGLKTPNADKAIIVLWFCDHAQQGVAMTAGQLVRIMGDHHLGTANATFLAKAIRKSKLCNESRDGFSLKPGSRNIVREWLPSHLDGMHPAMDHKAGYLPEDVWIRTKPYIESVCRQLNGSFKSGYYDAAQVMLRRLLETLIIEAYEHLSRQGEIKNKAGNYMMLGNMVERACGEKSFNDIPIGRDSKTTLKELREVGNWSAHSRAYNAVAADLTSGLKFDKRGVRLLVQELIQIAKIQLSAS